jgi:hypothetical protein
MFDELIDDCKEMSRRAKEVSKVRFYISFSDEKMENWANAVEYGNEKRAPKPFMRVTEEENRVVWRDLQQAGLSEYVMEGEDGGMTLNDKCAEIAFSMEEDYKKTAEEMGVNKRIIDDIRVLFEC